MGLVLRMWCVSILPAWLWQSQGSSPSEHSGCTHCTIPPTASILLHPTDCQAPQKSLLRDSLRFSVTHHSHACGNAHADGLRLERRERIVPVIHLRSQSSQSMPAKKECSDSLAAASLFEHRYHEANLFQEKTT